MSGKVEQYREALLKERDREEYLRTHSNLPGPRGNLELLEAAGDVATREELSHWTESADEFVAACGAAGLGRFAVDDPKVVARLKVLASDPRWRVREGVAMALQRIGDADWDALIRITAGWGHDLDLYVRRAAIAGVCEPRLLKNPKHAMQALIQVDLTLATVPRVRDRKTESFRVLRQALGYCASVAAAAAPSFGRNRFEEWMGMDDPDVRWIVRSNLRKARMKALGEDWLERQLRKVP
jgi:HEAT repeat protein